MRASYMTSKVEDERRGRVRTPSDVTTSQYLVLAEKELDLR